jgi:hypothetical protein
LYLPAGTLSISPGNTIANQAVKIRGAGEGATILEITAATGDLFVVSGNYFELSGMHIRPARGIRRTAGHVVNATGSSGLLRDLVITEPFRGIFLDGGTLWRIEDVLGNPSGEGGNWDYFLRTYRASGGTVSNMYLLHVSVNRVTSVQSAPILVIDSRTDTIECTGCVLLSNGRNPYPAIQTIDSDGTPGYPRFLHFTNSYLEARGGVCLDLQDVRDFGWSNGSIGSCKNAVRIGRGAKNVRITGSNFCCVTEHTIIIDPDASPYAEFTGNVFEGVSASSPANTYDLFNVGANAENFDISGNSARVGPNSVPARFGVHIAPGKSGKFRVVNNHLGDGVSGGTLRNGASGPDQSVFGNSAGDASAPNNR